jgi:hypothetical protein
VEEALAHAIRREADRDGGPRVDVLLALTRELEARRLARTNVVQLDTERAKRTR